MKRIALRRLSNQKHSDPLNVSIHESYLKALKEYKQLLASKQKAFHDNKIQQLQEIPGSSNSEHFWHIFKSMNDDITKKRSHQYPRISGSATMDNNKQEKIVSDGTIRQRPHRLEWTYHRKRNTGHHHKTEKQQSSIFWQNQEWND